MKSILIPAFIGLMITLIALNIHFLVKKGDPLISLAKEHWECSQSILKQDVTYVMSENVMVPVTLQDLVCVQYTKKGYQ